MNKKMINNIDYIYSFPYGRQREPRIEILKGKYKGLIFDVLYSGVSSFENKNEFVVKYNILKNWEKNEDKVINKNDEKYICECVYNFIIELNS